ncbi:hypothetical protein B0H19DRAFT_1024942 [Mycena capillaripes]|nr:hypothetical protein B0H19DRAFT_1024942 [Mycena capillaripes]
MNEECSDCRALHWKDERVLKSSVIGGSDFGICCDHGKVQLETLDEPPEPLRRLFVGADAQAIEFRTHITQYNSALAFTSLGVLDDKSINRHGPNAWVFRIQGNLYHLSGSLTAPYGIAPSYSQLYMHDPTVALQQRMNRNSNLRQDTMQSLQALLSGSHAYAAVYKQAYKVLDELGDVEDAEIRLRVVPGNDRRRYNLPTAEEIAVVLPGDDSSGDGRDIILRNRVPTDSPMLRISDLHPAYSPLYYVLLFPRGEHGWHSDLYLAAEAGKNLDGSHSFGTTPSASSPAPMNFRRYCAADGSCSNTWSMPSPLLTKIDSDSCASIKRKSVPRCTTAWRTQFRTVMKM